MKNTKYIPLSLSPIEQTLVSNAFLVLLYADSALDTSRTSYDVAYAASEKIDYNEQSEFTLKELRAISEAVDITLRLMAESPVLVSDLDDEFEGLSSSLSDGLPCLKQLAPRLHAIVSRHARK